MNRLTASMTLPNSVPAGQQLTYVVTLANTKANDIRYTTCPGYLEWGDDNGVSIKASYALNCEKVHSIPSGHSVRYQMKIAIPIDAPPGDVPIRWTLITGPNAPQAEGTVHISSAAAHRGHVALTGTAFGSARFGQSANTVIAYFTQLNGRPTQPYVARSGCGLDHDARWQDITAYFRVGRFVGYSYRGTGYTTEAGLRVGDRITTAQTLYGERVKYSAINGGRWWIDPSPAATAFSGYLIGPSGVRNHLVGPQSRIENISAGIVGCPSSPGL